MPHGLAASSGSPLAHLPAELAAHSVFNDSADGNNENLLILLHGLGDTAGVLVVARALSRMLPPSSMPVPRSCSLFRHRGHRALLRAGPFARLAKQMALPRTACLALGGPLAVPFAGRAWFTAFDDEGKLIEVRYSSGVLRKSWSPVLHPPLPF